MPVPWRITLLPSELYPSDPETYYQRALVKVSMNNKYDACLDFKRAEELGVDGGEGNDQEEL